MLQLKQCSAPAYLLAIPVNSIELTPSPPPHPQISMPRNAALEALTSSTVMWKKNKTYQWSTSPLKSMVSFALSVKTELLLVLQCKTPSAWLCPSVGYRISVETWSSLGRAKEREGPRAARTCRLNCLPSALFVFSKNQMLHQICCTKWQLSSSFLFSFNSIRHKCHCRVQPAWGLI